MPWKKHIVPGLLKALIASTINNGSVFIAVASVDGGG